VKYMYQQLVKNNNKNMYNHKTIKKQKKIKIKNNSSNIDAL